MISTPETQAASPAPISVLLSVHNGAKTLDRCLESIAYQTLPDIHIICIDDASTDDSKNILENWQKKFGEHMTILRNDKNLGLTLSLNRGIDAVTTPFIARIDADDWWEPTKLEKQAAFLATHSEYGVVGTNYVNHTPMQEKKITLPETDGEIKKIIFWHNPFAHSAVMYRTDVICEAGKYNPSVPYAQDYELWVRCFAQTKFHNLQEFLCHRTLGEGISVDKQNEQMRQYLKVLRTYLPLYHRPLRDYGAMVEPILVLMTPEWIKKLKRSYFP